MAGTGWVIQSSPRSSNSGRGSWGTAALWPPLGVTRPPFWPFFPPSFCLLPPGTRGKVKAHFKDAPVEEALKAVLAQANLQGVREGSIVTVSPREGGLTGRFEFRGELGPEIGRTVEEAMRTAERELRRAERDARTSERGGSSRDQERVGGDVVVEAGEDVRDVHAVGGNVTLKSGAEAREVVAVGGSVTLESGASAHQVVAVGGDVKVGPGAVVEQDAVSVGGKVQVDPSGDVGGQRTAVAIPGISTFLGKLSHRLDTSDASPGWSLAGALVAARRVLVRQRLIVVAALTFGVVEIVAGLMPSYLTFALMTPLLGLSALTMITSANTYMQLHIGPEMRGRVMALYMMIFIGGTPVGAPVVGWVGESMGARWTLILGGGLTILGVLASAAVFLWGRSAGPAGTSADLDEDQRTTA